MNTSRSLPLKQDNLWVGGDGGTRYRAGVWPAGGTCRGSVCEHAVNEGGNTGLMDSRPFIWGRGFFYVGFLHSGTISQCQMIYENSICPKVAPEGFSGTKRGKILPDAGAKRGQMRNLNVGGLFYAGL